MRLSVRKIIGAADLSSGQHASDLKRLILFGSVGVIGFAVDAALLFVAIEFAGAGPITGRFISIFGAMMTTWRLNRTFTFSITSGSSFSEIVRYASAKAAGLVANLTIYTAIVLVTPEHAFPLVALVVASGASLLINFALVKRYVFARQKSEIVQ